MIVRRADDIELLLQRRQLLRRALVLLRIPHFSSEESAWAQTAINKALKDCGCGVAGAFMLSGILMTMAWQSLEPGWGLAHWPGFLAKTVATMLVAGGVGKWAAMTRARLRLRRIVDRVRAGERQLIKE